MSDIIRDLTSKDPKKTNRPPKEYMRMLRTLRYSPDDQDMNNLKIGPMIPYPPDDPPLPLPKIEGVPEMGDPSDKLPPEAKKWKLT